VNFALSDEQVFLQEAARGALGRVKTVEAAREALEGGEVPDLWPVAREAGWPGLLVSEERGGAGLGAIEAMLVAAECGRVLAAVPLLGHVPATGLLDAAANADGDLMRRLAEGEERAAFLPARPPDDLEPNWTVAPQRGARRGPAPRLEDGTVTGECHWVPDVPGADHLVVAAVGAGGAPRAALVEAGGAGVSIEPVMRYDATRSLAHVRFEGAGVAELDLPEGTLAATWYLAQCLLAGEALGIAEECLERSVTYAKERFTFGRAIGSYQAVKHSLVEILRRMENLRSLVYYAGWARGFSPEEFPLAASSARVAADQALDHATRELISVHGGIGATWEHDAPLYFRRSQLSRRLLGGSGDAAERVAAELMAGARAAA